MDQDPRNAARFELCQGIANLAPNGSDDGGLVVLKGSHRLHDAYFEATGGLPARGLSKITDAFAGPRGYLTMDSDQLETLAEQIESILHHPEAAGVNSEHAKAIRRRLAEGARKLSVALEEPRDTLARLGYLVSSKHICFRYDRYLDFAILKYHHLPF